MTLAERASTAESRRAAEASRPASVPASLLRPIPWIAWALGIVLLAAAITATGALVYKHYTNAELPGCKAGSACDGLENHVLGRVLLPEGLAAALGFTKWPVSFLGFAYFGALAAAWIIGFRRVAPGLRWVIRLGAVVSAVYLVVIVAAEKYCKYCMASHAANFGLLACMEVGLMMAKARSGSGAAGRGGAGSGRRLSIASLAAFALGFVGLSAALGVKEHGIAMAAESHLAESERAMIEKAKADAERAAAAAVQNQAEEYDFGPKGFTGRWRLGPEKAQVRIVLFGAYTCQYCRAMEQIAIRLVEQNPGKVSFSFKHYPMNSACNPHMEKGKDPAEHANACWAARAAEASAIWAGANAAMAGEDQWTAANEAFWKAHKWLYSILGGFNDDSLINGLNDLGFDADKVTDLMTKPAANNPVVKDAEEGYALGLFQTPMIFVNGVELKGWQQPGALERTVASLIAAGAPAVDARNDKPDLARTKAIADWREESVKNMPPERTPRAIGPADAPAQIVVFGDFQEENTAKVDKIIRGWLSGTGGLASDSSAAKPVRYTFRNFPGDKACNDKLYKTFFEHGCLTARAAEAAGKVGGEAGYWKMHDWLMNNRSPMGLDAVKKGARAIGLDADAVVTAMSDSEVNAAIQEDIAAANAIGVGQIPAIYINGKFVKTWTREGDNVLERIVAEVSAGK